MTQQMAPHVTLRRDTLSAPLPVPDLSATDPATLAGAPATDEPSATLAESAPVIAEPTGGRTNLSTARSATVIAAEFEKAVEGLEELSTSGEGYYQTWLEKNEARLRSQATLALRAELAEAVREVGRLQSEFDATNTALSRRLTAVRQFVDAPPR